MPSPEGTKEEREHIKQLFNPEEPITLAQAAAEHTEMYCSVKQLEEKFDLVKIRRRCEERLRTMNDPHLLLRIARRLDVRLAEKENKPSEGLECRSCGTIMDFEVDAHKCSTCGEVIEVL